MSPNETTGATLPDELDERMKPAEQPAPLVDSDGEEIIDVDGVPAATDPTSPNAQEEQPADEEPTAPKMDSDHDGLSDELELMVGTNLLDADTDGDGLTDGFEYFSQAGLDPKLADTDGDESRDGEELLLGSNPTNVDTDGDGLQDGRDLLPTDATNTLGGPQNAPTTDPGADREANPGSETDVAPASSADDDSDSGPITSPSQVDDTLPQPSDSYDSSSVDPSGSYEDAPSDDMAMEYDG